MCFVDQPGTCSSIVHAVGGSFVKFCENARGKLYAFYALRANFGMRLRRQSFIAVSTSSMLISRSIARAQLREQSKRQER